MGISFDERRCDVLLDRLSLDAEIRRGLAFRDGLFRDPAADVGAKGWVHCVEAAVQIPEIERKAAEIREKADVFVLVGVGGSNQAARAVIEALKGGRGPRIIYAGNTLSASYLRSLLDGLEGKSVYINVIAKNFETLEPGIHYRLLRAHLEARYSDEEMSSRVILTGSRGSRLEEIAKERGHLFLDFPPAVGGRYSAFTPVGLLPLAVAGLDIAAYLHGGEEMERELEGSGMENTAVRYAATRNLLFKSGFRVEALVGFEPRLAYFNRWWWQLFGESEGKGGTGIFPSFAQYSEDLHSIGQYMQSGQRIIMETFLSVEDPGEELLVLPDPRTDDRFDYLVGKDFNEINRMAEEATMEAHSAGGVPCMKIAVERLDEYHFGQLYYFFMVACAVSGKLLGVNPFDQEGVERYKRSMFKALDKPGV